MPSMSDQERKRHILDHIVQTRQAFIRFLVLVQWAKNADEIQRCQASYSDGDLWITV
jgi:hypothetical protein